MTTVRSPVDTVFASVVILGVKVALTYFIFYTCWVQLRGYAISRRSMGAAFLLGAISSGVIAWPLETMVDNNLFAGGHSSRTETQAFLQQFLEAGMIEEAAKLMAALVIVSARPPLPRPIYGFIYSAVAALGFSAGECVCWDLQGRRNSPLIIGSFVHVLLASFWAASIGWVKYRRTKFAIPLVLLGLLASALAHGLLNFVSSGDVDESTWRDQPILFGLDPSRLTLVILVIAFWLLVKFQSSPKWEQGNALLEASGCSDGS
jgi:RsiW-degrading membrane proteinase PrsW (M82 family)